MNDEQLQTIEQVKQPPGGSVALEFRDLCVEEKFSGCALPSMNFTLQPLVSNSSLKKYS